jgi:NADPH:quinone reductase-like Zn-dependent oxidoreductase
MKAIVNRKYGTTSELKFEDVDKPTPKDGEVLVQVHATSVNSWDWDVLKGSFFNRLIYGPLKPKINVLGCDVAGVVSEVGNAVNRFKPGDEVFGDISSCGWGGFAEFVAADENALAIKPASMTFEQAASMPQAAL